MILLIEMPNIWMARKKKPHQKKPHNQLTHPGLQKSNRGMAKLCCLLPESARVSQLGQVRWAPRAEQCSCRGRSSLGPLSPQEGPGLSLRKCQEEHPGCTLNDLKHSFQQLSFVYCTCLCSSHHSTGEMLQSLSLTPHCKDNKSPVSHWLLGICCAGHLFLRPYPEWRPS